MRSERALRRAMLLFARPLPAILPPPQRVACSLRRMRVVAMSASRPNVLVTFDIDGTLLSGTGEAKGSRGGSAHKRSIDRAVREVFGIGGKVDDVPHAGSTDREIVRRVCALGGVADSEWAAGIDEVVRRASELIGDLIEDDLSECVLPGVPELLRELASRGAFMGLVTGNFATIAHAKMRSAGLGRFLSASLDQPSAFGSDCLHRNEILALAVDRAVRRGFVPERAGDGACSNIFHVGDAAADMAAARHVGGRGVGVLTGAFTREQLAAEKPHAVLKDLADTTAILAMIGV
jgi:phosphoglycolate phosphatase